MISYVTAVDCILHCSDENVVLTTMQRCWCSGTSVSVFL